MATVIVQGERINACLRQELQTGSGNEQERPDEKQNQQKAEVNVHGAMEGRK